MDVPALLGAVAQSYWRVRSGRHPNASGRRRQGRNKAADPRLQRSFGDDFFLPWILGFAGALYGVTAVVFGSAMILLALRLRTSWIAEQKTVHRLFAFSLLYLFVLFAMLLADAH